MTNEEIAQVLIHISQILNIKGENPFKIRAYTKASQQLQNLTYQLSALDDKNKIMQIPGIGEGIAKKILELLETGKLAYYEELRKSEYASMTEFLKIPGIGPRHARLIYEELGIATEVELKKAAEEGKLKELHGLGPKIEQNILRGIQQLQKYKERLPLAFVYPRAHLIFEQLAHLSTIKKITLAGSLRRMRETIADVDILVSSVQAEAVMHSFIRLPQTSKVLAQGLTKSSIVTRDGIQVDLRVVQPESFGAACHYFTGSKAHNIRIRSLGLHKGLKINEYGVFRDEKRIAGKTEAELFASVDLPYIPPELREDCGEIEAAQNGTLPALIEATNIKGDLHVHTSWTDGNNTIEEMAYAARKKGYEYLAICDHSSSMGIVNGLTPERLRKQVEEIKHLNSKLSGFRILSGIEVDIKPNGQLDLKNEILSELDLVVAAVHTKFGQPRHEMTARIIQAIENPRVTIIAHPTGRLIGKREPYQVDMDTVMNACRTSGKILELNSHPERLDLSDIHCRKAKEKGVKIAISTDSHSDGSFDLIKFGIATAKRGWIESSDVINTLTLTELMKFLRS